MLAARLVRIWMTTTTNACQAVTDKDKRRRHKLRQLRRHPHKRRQLKRHQHKRRQHKPHQQKHLLLLEDHHHNNARQHMFQTVTRSSTINSRLASTTTTIRAILIALIWVNMTTFRFGWILLMVLVRLPGILGIKVSYQEIQILSRKFCP